MITVNFSISNKFDYCLSFVTQCVRQQRHGVAVRLRDGARITKTHRETTNTLVAAVEQHPEYTLR